MSKSKGNTVSPVHLMKKYGADAIRLFVVFAAPPQQALEWSEQGVEGCSRFLHKLWHLAQLHQTMVQQHNAKDSDLDPALILDDATLRAPFSELHQLLSQAQRDGHRQQFNTVVSACMKMLNLLQRLKTDSQAEQYLWCHSLSLVSAVGSVA
jgi:leucyl-tRNA synthetase